MFSNAQKLMIADGLPVELILTQEERAAWWANNPDKGIIPTASFKDPKVDKETREQFARETTALRIPKPLVRRATRPATPRGKRWDPRSNKWVAINPTESRMKDDEKSAPAEQATTGTDSPKQVASNEDAMTTTTKAKKTSAKKPAAKKVAKKAKSVKSAKKGNGVARKPREGNKTADVLAAMRSGKGITRERILDMTGWKAVSVQQLVRNAGLNPDKDLKVSDERPFVYRLTK